MAKRIVWSPEAAEDLKEILGYIALDSLSNAIQVVNRIEQATSALVDFPNAGHPVPEFPDIPLRELGHTPYRVIYRVRQEEVQIVAVVHAARLLKRAINDRPLDG